MTTLPKSIGDGRSWLFLVCVVVLAALGMLLYSGLKPSGQTDQDRIVALLLDISAGVQRQNVRQVFSHVDQTFEVSGMNRLQAKAELLDFFRQYSFTNVAIQPTAPVFSGDHASVKASVDVTGALGGTGTPSSIYTGSITISFVKVPYRRFYIFPDYKWKIVQVTPKNPPQIEGM